jgi:predicted nucleic acid-binding protein
LLDTTAVVRANNLGESLQSYIGSDDLAVSETVRRELGRTQYDDLRAKWFALINGLIVIDETEEVTALANDIFTRFEPHDDPPEAADALIAAAALATGRTLVTENWRDFHFIVDLAFVDIRKVSDVDLPVLAKRRVQTGSPLLGGGCCRRLRQAGADT